MINWELAIKNIRSTGLSYKDIAMQTGFSITELADIESGDFTPQWIPCLKVIDLHLERCESRHNRILEKEELFHE